MKPLSLCMLMLALLTGCAGYKLTPITAADAEAAHNQVCTKRTEGYIFHAPKPYLLASPVMQDGRLTYQFSIIYLPDYSKPYRFTRYEFLAKSDTDISFTDGWMLANAKSSTDSTDFISKLLDSVPGLGFMSAEQKADPISSSFLYRMDIDSFNNIQLVRVNIDIGQATSTD